jgi:tetratricopeptide (TPR) repeat protein
LINDYGMTQPSDAVSLGATQRFGSSAALGLNFPFLAHHFSSRVALVSRPAMDERLPLHPMLLANRSMPQTNIAFHSSFDFQTHEDMNGPQDAARQHIDAGRFDQAMQAYREALQARPRDWALMGEIAEFLTRHIADYESGKKMAEAALAVNPWYSVWLWNLLGDAVYAMDRFSEAHECYLKAEAMEPNDVRTALNLGYSYYELGQPERALLALARGLAGDSVGLYRERLLEKQQQILAGLTAQRRIEQEWLARRAARLAS